MCNVFFYLFRGSLINFQSLCIVEGILRFLQDVWFIFAVFVLILNDDELGQNFPGKDNVITFLKWMKKKRNPNQQRSSTNNNVTTTYYNPSQIVVEEKKIWLKWGKKLGPIVSIKIISQEKNAIKKFTYELERPVIRHCILWVLMHLSPEQCQLFKCMY